MTSGTLIAPLECVAPLERVAPAAPSDSRPTYGPRCRLRFTPAAAAYIIACAECGDSPQPIASLERALGFRLIGQEDLSRELPYSTAASLVLRKSDGAR